MIVIYAEKYSLAKEIANALNAGNKEFDASLKINEQGKLEFIFPARKKKK